MKQLLLFAALVLCAGPARAQMYEHLQATHPGAQEMHPLEPTQALERPHPRAHVVANLAPSDTVLAFEQVGPWWKVATRARGYIGYVRATMLVPLEEQTGYAPQAPVLTPGPAATPVARTASGSGLVRPVGYKAPAPASHLGFLVVGGRQFYAGEGSKGLGLQGEVEGRVVLYTKTT